jgi:hypothetical protein
MLYVTAELKESILVIDPKLLAACAQSCGETLRLPTALERLHFVGPCGSGMARNALSRFPLSRRLEYRNT